MNHSLEPWIDDGFTLPIRKVDLGFCRIHQRNYSHTRTSGQMRVILISMANGITRSDSMLLYDIHVLLCFLNGIHVSVWGLPAGMEEGAFEGLSCDDAGIHG